MVLLTFWLFLRASFRSICCGTSRGRCGSCIACRRLLVTSGSTFGAPAVQTGSRRVSTDCSRAGWTTWSRSPTMRDANVSRCCSWAALEWVRCSRRRARSEPRRWCWSTRPLACGRAEDYPEGFSDDEFDAIVAMGVEVIFSVETQAPRLVDDAGFRRWYERAIRLGAAPDVQRRRFLAACNTDVRGVLGSVQTPTLVVAHQGARMCCAAPLPGRPHSWGETGRVGGFRQHPPVASTPGRSSTQPRSFSPTIAVLPSLIGCSRPCCSPTS